MKEAGDDRAAKSAIGKEWMPADYKAVNIYFPVGQNNPSDLEGRVMFYKAPRTCFDIWVEALERTGPGDSLDPQAYSAFFDENAAFMFQLSCKVKGQNNTYESSGFLANGGTPTAMSDAAGIQQILSARFDLSTKIDTPDIESLNKIAQNLINGVEDDGFGTPSAPVTAAPPVQAAPVMNVAPVPVQPAVQVAPAPVQAAPVQATPVQAAPVQAAPVQAAPVQAAPVQAAPVQAAPVQAAPVQAVPAPVQVAPVPVQAAPVEVAQPAPSEAAPAQAAPAAAPAPAVETVQPPAGGGGGDDVMNEIESMLEGFSN